MAQLILESSLQTLNLAKSFRDKWTTKLGKVLTKLEVILNFCL